MVWAAAACEAYKATDEALTALETDQRFDELDATRKLMIRVLVTNLQTLKVVSQTSGVPLSALQTADVVEWFFSYLVS